MISDQTWRFLEPSTENFESVTKDEVQAGLESGDFALFESPKSAAVTCAYGKSLRIGLAGGDLEELKEIEKEICNFAKSREFRFIEIIGRPGWERELTDYKRTAVLLKKEL
jgi:hypothetical protein|tara:strand:+ start:2458 stop:2790 length:333 start_codon:yes stop_codon:yes gene_type:complete